MSLKTEVEKEDIGKRCQYESLVNNVHNVWKDVESVESFKSFFENFPVI